MQALDAYLQGIQDGEMWPGDGSHNIIARVNPISERKYSTTVNGSGS